MAELESGVTELKCRINKHEVKAMPKRQKSIQICECADWLRGLLMRWARLEVGLTCCNLAVVNVNNMMQLVDRSDGATVTWCKL